MCVTLQTVLPRVTKSRDASAKPCHGCVRTLEDESQVITQVKGPVSAKERCVDSSRFAGNTCSANLSVVYLPRWGRKTREVQAAPRHAATPTDHVPGCPERVVTPVTDTRPGMAVSKKGRGLWA